MNNGRKQQSRSALQSIRAKNEALLAERSKAAKNANPQRDPDGIWHLKIRQLSEETGAQLDALLDEWDERSAIIEYEAKAPRPEAERLAFEVVKSNRRQKGLFE